MEHLPEIGSAFGTFALGMFSPGPNILSVVGTSAAKFSARSCSVTSIGICPAPRRRKEHDVSFSCDHPKCAPELSVSDSL